MKFVESILIILVVCVAITPSFQLKVGLRNVLNNANNSIMKKFRLTEKSATMTDASAEAFLLNRGGPNDSFSCTKAKIQEGVENAFRLRNLVDTTINQDNSLRFYTVKNGQTSQQIMKLYFKGKPEQCEFYNGEKDQYFKNSVNDCLNHQLIEKRLYPEGNAPAKDGKKVPKKSKFPDILFPKCITDMKGPPIKSNYYNIFTVPKGTSLEEKCIHGLNLNEKNSCIEKIADITRAIVHGIEILNSGDKWLKHGSIFLKNTYLYILKDNSVKVFLDNMRFETTKYEDKNNMPFKDDFMLLGNMLLQLVAGSDSSKIFKRPFFSSVDIWMQTKHYFTQNEIFVNLKPLSFNIPQNFGEPSNKISMLEDMEEQLKDSFFNFVFRLLCSGTNPVNQFPEVKSAMDHKFIKIPSKEQLKQQQALAEAWNTYPADY